MDDVRHFARKNHCGRHLLADIPQDLGHGRQQSFVLFILIGFQEAAMKLKGNQRRARKLSSVEPLRVDRHGFLIPRTTVENKVLD